MARTRGRESVVRLHRLVAVPAIGLAAMLTLSGCGAVDSLTGGKKTVKATVVAAQNPRFGTVVTDGDGHTLYRYDLDKAHPPTSNCVGECSANWIPEIGRASCRER